ncbi:MAG TPA: glycosyltransferase [Candidatus Acidoferrales bacterium]|nr:glycosyltransferase [Candidatus Acidoferrales bacterium]
MLYWVIGFLILTNLVYALRSVEFALRSRYAIEPVHAPAGGPLLSIIIPARNEQRQIEACVRSVLAQDYPNFEVIVVDDRSEDTTAQIVARVARDDARVRLVEGKPLPPGWVGKPWALHQALEHARGEWLLFTDADTVHEHGAASAAMTYARERDLGALSVLTNHTMVTLPERMLVPSILWAIAFAVGPLADVNDPNHESALFNGQYLLVRRDAYEAIGGHAAVGAEIAEDLELARSFKADGRFRTMLVGANGLVHVRMYRSFAEIWEGFVKNFALGVRGRPWLAALGIFFFACVSPLTPIALVIALFAQTWGVAGALLIAMLLAVACASFGMRRAGFGVRSGWCLPIGTALVVAIFLTSVALHASGGVTWRGRRYSGTSAS